MKPKPSVSQCLGDAAGVGFWGRVGEGVYLCSCRRSIDDPGAYFWNNQDQRRVYKTFPCVSILFWCIDERQRNTTGPLVFFENAPSNPSLRFERGARDAHKSRKEKKNTSSQYSSTPKTSNLLRSFGVWVMFRIKAPPGQSLTRSLLPSSLDVLWTLPRTRWSAVFFPRPTSIINNASNNNIHGIGRIVFEGAKRFEHRERIVSSIARPVCSIFWSVVVVSPSPLHPVFVMIAWCVEHWRPEGENPGSWCGFPRDDEQVSFCWVRGQGKGRQGTGFESENAYLSLLSYFKYKVVPTRTSYARAEVFGSVPFPTFLHRRSVRPVCGRLVGRIRTSFNVGRALPAHHHFAATNHRCILLVPVVGVFFFVCAIFSLQKRNLFPSWHTAMVYSRRLFTPQLGWRMVASLRTHQPSTKSRSL